MIKNFRLVIAIFFVVSILPLNSKACAYNVLNYVSRQRLDSLSSIGILDNLYRATATRVSNVSICEESIRHARVVQAAIRCLSRIVAYPSWEDYSTETSYDFIYLSTNEAVVFETLESMYQEYRNQAVRPVVRGGDQRARDSSQAHYSANKVMLEALAHCLLMYHAVLAYKSELLESSRIHINNKITDIQDQLNMYFGAEGGFVQSRDAARFTIMPTESGKQDLRRARTLTPDKFHSLKEKIQVLNINLPGINFQIAELEACCYDDKMPLERDYDDRSCTESFSSDELCDSDFSEDERG